MKLLLAISFGCLAAAAQTLPCDMSAYRAMDGLHATVTGDTLEVAWQGERNTPLRARFGIRAGRPIVRELAAGDKVLARDLAPEFEITSGKRRMSQQQIDPLRALGIALTPELIEHEKWNAFWDAPLQVPGTPGRNLDLPRRPEEIRRIRAGYQASTCSVRSEGARIEITFPGLSAGIFSGELRFTVYRGANLLRQEAIAKTDEPSVAYKYDAGLTGFALTPDSQVRWRDVAGMWQRYEFGGAPNTDRVALRARGRAAIVETGGGSLAVFPSPHRFFWAREIEVNQGYVWYRKDDERGFSAGVRQAEREEAYTPYGITDAVWKRQVDRARDNRDNQALYNAPPGTMQRMPVYWYLSTEDAPATYARVLAYTHNDEYKPVPGYQVAVSHFHLHFQEELQDAGTMDLQSPWISVFRSLGVNIAILADFHGDGAMVGPARLRDQAAYFAGARRFSDRSFLIVPGEEASYNDTGHLMTAMPKPVYWERSRVGSRPLVENEPGRGKVYHVRDQKDLYAMLEAEGGYAWQSHPRTKGSTGFPDHVREEANFRGERFLGGSWESLPVDQSERRLCEARCFGTLDDMNNWAGPKYLIAEGDTYTKYPEDETYPYLGVNYVKMDRLPRFDEGWAPLLRAMRAGDYFISTGEVLLKNYGVEGSGSRRTFAADVEWTFPLEFVEVVWGDGEKTGREVVAATGEAPFGSRRLQVPFDATGKKWVRFAVWDSAGNGAFTQPTMLR
jgi:hypothetical protein